MCQTHAVIRFRMLYEYECGWLHWDRHKDYFAIIINIVMLTHSHAFSLYSVHNSKYKTDSNKCFLSIPLAKF